MLDQVSKSVTTRDGVSAPAWARALAPSVQHVREIAVADARGVKLQVHRGSDAEIVVVSVPRATSLSRASLRGVVSEVFCTILESLRDGPFPHPARMWNFVPGIHDPMGEDVDRYRVFNSGRHDAFTRWFGAAETFGRSLPAASAVGHDGDQLVVWALGLRNPGVPIENPRQIPAFGYSRAHGPLPPCFSRAVVAQLPGGTRLLVSGTASIRGESSVHAGSLEGQLEETFQNLHHLTGSVSSAERFSLNGVETARVYFPREADRDAMVAGVSSRLPLAAEVEYIPAWICRSELLVEIEATIAPVSR